eukprot:scaffold11862_cov74-Cyclotella_meneghiniana.AAC.5
MAPAVALQFVDKKGILDPRLLLYHGITYFDLLQTIFNLNCGNMNQLRHTLIRTIELSLGSLAILEITTHLPSEGRSSEAYHALFDTVITPLGRRIFSPENAHNLALEVVKRGLAPRAHICSSVVDMRVQIGQERRLVMDSPIGLAAGFDKNGVAIGGLFDLGFSVVEIGSVTPLPQPGNAKPRSFRLAEDRGVINRFGFNSEGAHVVRDHLMDYRKLFGGRGIALVPTQVAKENEENEVTEAMENELSSKPEESNDTADINLAKKRAIQISQTMGNSVAYKLGYAFDWALHKITTSPHRTGVLGVNLGKNKTSEDEVGDYTYGIKELGPFADYLVINVSSPNTPGLRSLQQADRLRNLITSTQQARDTYAQHAPLFVKLAPDLSMDELKEVANVIMETKIDGMIVSNTTNARPDFLLSKNKSETGGLSGAPIREKSTECIRTMYKLTSGNVPIIGVGGVGSGRDAYEKIKAGASLIQVYSMMVYEGPGLISRIRNELAEIVADNGHKSVEEVVGSDNEEIYWRKREERVKRKMKEAEGKTFIDM